MPLNSDLEEESLGIMINIGLTYLIHNRTHKNNTSYSLQNIEMINETCIRPRNSVTKTQFNKNVFMFELVGNFYKQNKI